MNDRPPVPLEVRLYRLTTAGDPSIGGLDGFELPPGGSGGPYVSGWVNAFFPYIRGPQGSGEIRNPYAIQWYRESWSGGPNSADFPGGLRSVPFVWDYLRTLIPMQFLGGFLGVQQDEDGTVAPQVGWAVVDLTEQPPEPRPPRLPPSCPLR